MSFLVGVSRESDDLADSQVFPSQSARSFHRDVTNSLRLTKEPIFASRSLLRGGRTGNSSYERELLDSWPFQHRGRPYSVTSRRRAVSEAYTLFERRGIEGGCASCRK